MEMGELIKFGVFGLVIVILTFLARRAQEPGPPTPPRTDDAKPDGRRTDAN
jgi:hypothetical protein